jgi:hypothetical protein
MPLAYFVANHFLETDLEKLKAAVSIGYARGRCRVIARIGMIEVNGTAPTNVC